MANNKKSSRKGKVKFRFYVFCFIFALLVILLIKMSIGLLSKDKKEQKAQDSPEPAPQETQLEEKQLDATKQEDSAEQKATSAEKKEDVGYTEIVVNFKDAAGNPINMNILPNCFITNIVEEVQWKKAVFNNLFDIKTNEKENLSNTPSLESFTGNTVTIKMNTTVEQYFRFIFVPIDKKNGYNPELHKELNIYFTTTPADNGVRVEYDAVVDYYAAMSDDVLKLNIVKEEYIAK